MPRASSSGEMAARFSAVRCPAMALLGGLIVILDAAHAHAPRAGQNFDLLLLANGA